MLLPLLLLLVQVPFDDDVESEWGNKNVTDL